MKNRNTFYCLVTDRGELFLVISQNFMSLDSPVYVAIGYALDGLDRLLTVQNLPLLYRFQTESWNN